MVAALIQQLDYQMARKYWNKLKERLKKEGSQSVTNCHRLNIKGEEEYAILTNIIHREWSDTELT